MSWLKFSGETALWLTLNLILLSIILILLSKFLKRLKSMGRVVEEAAPTLKLCSVFDYILRMHGPKRALTDTFLLLLEAIASRVNVEIPKSLTSKEVMSRLRERLEGRFATLLDKMYALYEPTRFWSHHPTEHELAIFRAGLLTLDGTLKTEDQTP
ncbi:MAG: hypothetical protein ACUVTM_01580 [Candidatus Bathyarchaeia archaeon]